MEQQSRLPNLRSIPLNPKLIKGIACLLTLLLSTTIPLQGEDAIYQAEGHPKVRLNPRVQISETPITWKLSKSYLPNSLISPKIEPIQKEKEPEFLQRLISYTKNIKKSEEDHFRNQVYAHQKRTGNNPQETVDLLYKGYFPHDDELKEAFLRFCSVKLFLQMLKNRNQALQKDPR